MPRIRPRPGARSMHRRIESRGPPRRASDGRCTSRPGPPALRPAHRGRIRRRAIRTVTSPKPAAIGARGMPMISPSLSLSLSLCLSRCR